MNKITILSSALSKLGFISESSQLIFMIKLADSRGSIVNQLHMTKEQADFFHGISSQRSFDLARWFKEWFEKKFSVSGSEYRNKINLINNLMLQGLFSEFKQEYSLIGAELSEEEEEEGGERKIFDFIDTVLNTSSPLFNKVKRKSLDEAFSDFRDYIIKENFIGTEYYKDEDDKDLAWYDVGTQCDLVAAFLKNCGRLSYLNSGDYRGAFTMMALKNKKGIPLAVVTVGEVYDEEGNPINIVTSFDSAYAPDKPTPSKILDALFDMVKSKGLTFANLIFESDLSASGESLKFLAAQQDLPSILGAGFEVKDIEM